MSRKGEQWSQIDWPETPVRAADIAFFSFSVLKNIGYKIQSLERYLRGPEEIGDIVFAGPDGYVRVATIENTKNGYMMAWSATTKQNTDTILSADILEQMKKESTKAGKTTPIEDDRALRSFLYHAAMQVVSDHLVAAKSEKPDS